MPGDTTDASSSTGGSTGGVLGTDSTTAPSSSSDSSGGLPDGLVEAGLLARYYLDEADTGQARGLVEDAAPAPLDLPITLHGQNPEYTEVDGNRGLSWGAIESNGRAGLVYDGTKLMDALQGSTTGTIEVIADVQDVSIDSSRLCHFGLGDEGGEFTIAAATLDRLIFRTAIGTPTARWSVDLTGGRTHYTIVWDTDNEVADDRARLYVNGEFVAPDVLASIPSGAGLSFTPGGSFVLGNRAIGARSFEGVLFYAALYETALTQAEIQHNASILQTSDDTPR